MKKETNSGKNGVMKGLSEEEINSPEFDPDEFAPAPDTAVVKEENNKEKNKFHALLFAAVVAVMALVIGILGWVASDNMGSYSQKRLEKKILAIYEGCNEIERYKSDEAEVYAVLKDKTVHGYCAVTETDGFSGKIKLLVAFDTQNSVTKVSVLSHNESLGLGSKIKDNEFLSQFEHKAFASLDFEYDMISGATASSEGVVNGIKAVCGIGLNAEKIAKSMGYECYTDKSADAEKEDDKATGETGETGETTDNKKDPVQEKPVDTAETTAVENVIGPSSFVGSANSNASSGIMGHSGGGADTTYYETEGVEPETTAPEEETKKETEEEREKDAA